MIRIEYAYKSNVVPWTRTTRMYDSNNDHLIYIMSCIHRHKTNPQIQIGVDFVLTMANHDDVIVNIYVMPSASDSHTQELSLFLHICRQLKINNFSIYAETPSFVPSADIAREMRYLTQITCNSSGNTNFAPILEFVRNLPTRPTSTLEVIYRRFVPTDFRLPRFCELLGLGDQETTIAGVSFATFDMERFTFYYHPNFDVPRNERPIEFVAFGPTTREVRVSAEPDIPLLRHVMSVSPWPDVLYDPAYSISRIYRNRVPALLQLFSAARPPLALARFLKRDGDNAIKTLVAEFLFGSDGECWDEVR
jgi:hypothetical protein